MGEEYGEKFGKVEAGCEQGTLQSLNFLTLILLSILYMPICFDVSEVEPMHCEIQEKFFHFILDTFFATSPDCILSTSSCIKNAETIVGQREKFPYLYKNCFVTSETLHVLVLAS